MATLSSIGIGSGLQAESIITQLVALERKPVPLSDEEAAVTAVAADKTSPAVSNDSLKH